MVTEHRARFSADIGSPFAAGPPGNPPIERVRDVLIVAGDPSVDQGDSSELIMLPTWDGPNPYSGAWRDPEPIPLFGGLAIDRLDRDESERVMNACSPRGHYFVPVRQFGQMFSFVLEIDPAEIEHDRWNWNTEGLISDAVAMSRLVLDNGYSYEYAARIFDHEGGEQHIMPASVHRSSYRLRTTRDWMIGAEADALRNLLSGYREIKQRLSERIEHAFWLSEYATSVHWLDVIAPLLVIAFEGLISTGNSLVARQFRERVPALTADVDSSLSAEHCRQMYDVRSRWVHGDRVSMYRRPNRKDEEWEGPSGSDQEEAVERIAATQDALRAVLRKSIEDEEFRLVFDEAASIRQRWPVIL